MDTVVLDDFVSDEYLYMVHNFFDNITWNYQNQANRNAFGKGTHRFFGANFYPEPDVVRDDFWINNSWMKFLWEAVSKHLNVKGEIQSVRANLQVAGQDGTWHKDGEDLKALIYFPNIQWRPEWGGNLDIKENESYEYVPGRIIYMDGSKDHRANAPLIKNKARISLVYNIAD